MKRIAEITLTENSTAGSPPKIFAAQTVEIAHKADTVVQGVDGLISTARHPSKIRWFGGKSKDLENITNVKIVGDDGEMLVDGELNTTYGVPCEVAEGVEFFVLKPAWA